ncbi:MAG TPA: DinB family protein [Acidimicrobiales bacterium]|nr:DinB family protein [Acidimicrobiales bacterium]
MSDDRAPDLDEHLLAALGDQAAIDQRAAVASLAAAERAIEEGRFNIAKVLRAAAHASRVRALELERLAAAGKPSPDRLRAEREHQHQAAAVLGELVHEAERAGDRAMAERLTRLLHATHETARVLDASATSLVRNRDILESDVAQYLFVCTGCGRIAEASPGEACPVCGALPPEFAGYFPFFVKSDENLGRRRPAEIVAMLEGDPDRLAGAVAGLDEAVLLREPGPGEWCIVEVAGHMVDVATIFNDRLRVHLNLGPADPEVADKIPWLLTRERRWRDHSMDEIVSRFRHEVGSSLELIGNLDTEGAWGERVRVLNGRATIIELGTWFANHNQAHLQQVLALRSAPDE